MHREQKEKTKQESNNLNNEDDEDLPKRPSEIYDEEQQDHVDEDVLNGTNEESKEKASKGLTSQI